MSTQPPSYQDPKQPQPQGFQGYYPEGQGQPYPPQPAPVQHTTTVVQQPVYPVVTHFSSTPTRMTCTFCNADIVTSCEYENGLLTYLACFIVCLFLPLGCCLIPFCVNGCKDVVHSCPNCRQVVGRYKPM